ncbi:type 1 fimbrial protein [Serratia fonticola]|uniref:fimbrial protein n=1 Tax=Serratia fonticola TaxID=47917 RepID=UPI001575BE3F|nr:fimbrial protein [Serratia fonticola]NTY86590.1 type 1 fimbrial protein [Serratia fonticola]NTZ12475.1 type 1 fimbrial protein [Serratia fonticola]
MKLNQLVMALGLGVAMIAGGANAADDQGHGSVNFEGSIIDAPCSIDPDTIDQTVNLGQVSNVALQADNNTGTSIPKTFQIRLEGCNLSTAETVLTTFRGAEGANGLLGITGTAKGASIAITDGTGKLIELGQASKPQGIGNGSNTLQFSAYLQGDGASATIVPGNFTSVADFTLAYQ